MRHGDSARDAGPTSVGRETHNVAGALLRALRFHGVEHVFCNAGTDFAPIVAAMRHGGADVPRMHTVLHETVAVGLAHGVTLATGRAQAVMVHVNVGTANAVMGLLNAAREQIPMLLLAGRTPWTEAGRLGSRNSRIHWGQEMFDQAGMVREAVKWDYELRAGEQVEPLVGRALAIATSDPCGPTYLSLPREVLAEPSSDAATHERRPAVPPEPSDVAIDDVAALLIGARTPLIIVSQGDRELFDVLGPFAQRLGIAVAQPKPTRLAIPTDHPCVVGGGVPADLGDVDVVVTLSTMVPWSPDAWAPGPGATIVEVGPDPLYATIPVRSFPADLSIAARPARFIERLQQRIEERGGVPPEEAERRRSRLADVRADRAVSTRASRSGEMLSRAAISRCISEVMDDATVFSEFGAVPSHMTLRRWDSYFGSPIAGGLGWGLPAAIGYKLARPDRLVVATVGDGSYVFANPSASHRAAAAMNAPVLTVVFDNQEWGAVRGGFEHMYGATHTDGDPGDAVPLVSTGPSPDYPALMGAFGGRGWRVDDRDGLVEALREARAHVERGGQALVAVRCAPSA